MTQYSYSRVSLYEDCPYHFKLRYIDQLTELPRYDPYNPLILGNAMHAGIEKGVEYGVEQYFNSYPVITNKLINEAIKLELLIPRVHAWLDEMFPDCKLIHEYEIDDENFKGFVDLIVETPDGKHVVIDFKYSNNVKNYLDSGQLHIYKDKLDALGFNVVRLGYLFIPKVSIKQSENEELFHYRKRIEHEVKKAQLKFVPIDFDSMQYVYFLNSIEQIEAAKVYPKNVSGKCFACMPKFAPDYLELVTNSKGDVLMALPKNERRERKIDTKPDLWLYADSYVGKSTFVDQFPNVLFANTDGNTDNTTAPVEYIKDEITKVGRKTERIFAWEKFLNIIDDLETEENTFEAIALDLVEDLRDHCRVYVFEKNGWEHESDGSFGKGWDKVKTEFNRAIKRLKTLGYQIIYISKEIKDEVTLKGGAKRTTFRPNVDEKTANFLTGTVDLTIRAFVNSDDERFLQLAKKQNVFGGGRFDFKQDVIPLDYEEFIEALKEAQEESGAAKKSKRRGKSSDDGNDDERSNRRRKSEPEPEPDEDDEQDEQQEEEEKPRNRRNRREEPAEDNEQEEKTRSRRKRNEEVDEESDEPKRERRGRSKSDDEEKPRERKRRERKPLDDTPPGEDDDGPEEEETTSRRRRTRR